MNAVEMISEAGFDVVEAGNADEAIAVPRSAPGHPRRVHRYPNARFHGWLKARPVRAGPLASDQDCRNFLNIGKDDLSEGGRFVPKPYHPEYIVATLRELTAVA